MSVRVSLSLYLEYLFEYLAPLHYRSRFLEEELDAGKLKKLRPAFKTDGGSVTGGNVSCMSDGAAALVLVSGSKAKEIGLQVIAKIRGFVDAAQSPELFTTLPALAIRKALSRAGIEQSQVDFYEINESFDVVALANQQILKLDRPRLWTVVTWSKIFSIGRIFSCSY